MDISIGIIALLAFTSLSSSTQPSIIFIVADDLGWNDVGWHNNKMYTPNLDYLAETGVKLEQYYVQAICTPSRSAFLSGYYPFRTGMQHGVIHELEPVGLPVNFTLLPQYLRKLGYATHIVGKWHLGFCDWKYTPTYRGFDSFFGYYNGDEDYFTHRIHDGLDFHHNKKTVSDFNGTYSTEIFAEQAKNIISNHDSSHPLFLYLPFQSVHAPLQVPDKYIERYSYIHDKSRRTYSGMVSALDEAVGNITETLIQKGLYGNSVIIFTSDNGGQVQYGGNNYPLRGNKNTLWEGGHRVPAFVHSSLLNNKSYINTKLIHAVDWLPTILHLASGNQSQYSNLNTDGYNQWPTISNDGKAGRNEFIYNIDNKGSLSAAIRVGDFKLIVGDPGVPSGWIPPSNYTISDCSKNYRPSEMFLFNLTADPTEHANLARTLPGTVKLLWKRLKRFVDQAVPPFKRPDDPKGDPANFGGNYMPGWCNAEPRKITFENFPLN